MKKIMILSILLGFIAILGLIGYTHFNENALYLTDDEKNYILANHDTVFMAGYYPTNSEKRFSEKLCEQIEQDTGIHISLYKTDWPTTITKLKSGDLPIVFNMNETAPRKSYANFTATFAPIPSGIYSKSNLPIDSFAAINGKRIGIEQDNALMNAFIANYPNLGYELKVFTSYDALKNALHNNLIDGFIATKSFEDTVDDLAFFQIDSISESTNHIGVNKNYDILYNILNKEVNYLIAQNWDQTISDVLNFELERSQIDFSSAELDYIEENQTLRVGIPNEYFLYYYGEQYSRKGIIPEIIEKIAFITNLNLYLTFDTLDNLRLREDIDFYIDNSAENSLHTNTIFTSDIIAIGRPDQASFKEIYELASYHIGILGVATLEETLTTSMPFIKVTDYDTASSAKKALDHGDIDYLILPHFFYNTSVLRNDYIERGEYGLTSNYFIAKNAMQISLLNKALAIIDTEKIIEDEAVSSASSMTQYYVFLILIILGFLIWGIRMIRLKLLNLRYQDKHYHLPNQNALERYLKGREGYLCLIKVKGTDEIKVYYGKKIYVKYMRHLIKIIKQNISDSDLLASINVSEFSIMTSNQSTIEALNNQLKKSIYFSNVSIPYKTDIAYVDVTISSDVDALLSDLSIGLVLSQGRENSFYYNDQQKNIFKNKLNREKDIQMAIEDGNIDLLSYNVQNQRGEYIGSYITPNVLGLPFNTLKKYTEKLKCQVLLDTSLLKKVLTETNDATKTYFIKIADETLLKKDFLTWVMHIKEQHTLYFLISLEAYQRLDLDNLEFTGIHLIIRDFGGNLKTDIDMINYPANWLMLDEDLSENPDEYESLIAFIFTFAKEHHKKIITTSPFLKECDYYIQEVPLESTHR